MYCIFNHSTIIIMQLLQLIVRRLSIRLKNAANENTTVRISMKNWIIVTIIGAIYRPNYSHSNCTM